MDDYAYDHSWSINGDYNWKASLDDYNECYHCPTTHPLFAENCDLKKYRVEVEGGEILHFIKDKPGKSTNSYAPSSFFPNTAVSITKDYWYHMSVCPTSPTTAIMKYGVYRHKDASDEAFVAIDKFFKQVEDEDKRLCNGSQLNLNLGTYAAGQLQPEQERGVLHFQNLVREAVMEHRQKEDELKEEIWPARQSPAANGDVKFCSGLEACLGAQVPAW